MGEYKHVRPAEVRSTLKEIVSAQVPSIKREQMTHEKEDNVMKRLSFFKVEELSKDLLEDFREAFKLFDKQNDGTIQAWQLKAALQQLGQEATDDEIIMMISSVDQEGNGRIEFEQFVKMMAPKLKRMEPKEELLEAFKTFDRDGNGFISAEELKHVMGCMGEKLSEDEVQAMIGEADMDGDGQINYQEFLQLMNSGE